MTLFFRRAAAYRLALRCTTAMFAMSPLITAAPLVSGTAAYASDKETTEETVESSDKGGGFVFDLDTFVGRLKVGPERGGSEKKVVTKKSTGDDSAPGSVTGDTDNSFADNSFTDNGGNDRAGHDGASGQNGKDGANAPGQNGKDGANAPVGGNSGTGGLNGGNATSSSSSPSSPSEVRRYFIDPDKSSLHFTGSKGGRPSEAKIPVKGGTMTYDPKAPEKTTLVLDAKPESEGALHDSLNKAGVITGKGKPPRFVVRKFIPLGDDRFDVEGDMIFGSGTERVQGTGEIMSDNGKYLVARANLPVNPKKLGLNDLDDAAIDAVIYASDDPNAAMGEGGGNAAGDAGAAAVQDASSLDYVIIPEKSALVTEYTYPDGSKKSPEGLVTGGSVRYDGNKPEQTSIQVAAQQPTKDGASGVDTRFVSRSVKPDGAGGFDIEGDMVVGGQNVPVKSKGKTVRSNDDSLEIQLNTDLAPKSLPVSMVQAAGNPKSITNKTTLYAEKGKSGAFKKPGADDSSALGLVDYTVVPEKSNVTVTSTVLGSDQSGRAPVLEGKIKYSKSKPESTVVDLLTSQDLDGPLGASSKAIRLFKDYPTSRFLTKTIIPGADGKSFKVEGELTMGGETQLVNATGETVQDDGKVLVIHTVLEITPAVFPKALAKVKSLVKKMKIDSTLYATRNPDSAGAAMDKPAEPPVDAALNPADSKVSTGAAPSDQASGMAGNYIVVPEKSEVNVTADMMGTKTSGKSPVKEGKITYSRDAQDKTVVDMLTSLELDGALGTASKTVGLFKNDPTSHFVSKKVTPNADGKTFKVEGDLTMAGDTQPVTGDGELVQDDGNVLVIRTKLTIDPGKFAKAFGAAKAMVSGLEIDAKLYATKDPNSAGSGSGGGNGGNTPAQTPPTPASGDQPSTPSVETKDDPATTPTTGGATGGGTSGTPAAPSGEAPAAGAVRYNIIPEKSRSTGYTTLIGGMKQDTTSKVTGGFIEYDKSKLEEMHFEATKEAVPSALMEQAGVNAKDLAGKMVMTKIIPDGQGGFDYEGDVFMDGETKKAKGKAKILVDDGNVLEISVVSDGDSSMVPKALGKFKSMVENIHNETVFHAERDPSAAPAGNGNGGNTPAPTTSGDQAPASVEDANKGTGSKEPVKASAEASEKGSEETPKSSDQASGMAGNYIVVPEKSEVNVTADMMGTKTSGKSPVKEGKITYSRDAQDKTAVDMLTSLELDGALGTAAKTVGLFKNDPTSHFVSKKVTPNADGKTFKVEGDLTMAGDTQPVTGDGELVQDDGNVLVIRTKLTIDPGKFAKAFGAAKAMVSGLEIDAKLYATKDPNAAGSGSGSDEKKDNAEGEKSAEEQKKEAEGQKKEAEAKDPAKASAEASEKGSEETPKSSDQASGMAGNYIVVPEKSEVNVTADMMGTKTSGKSPVKEGKITYSRDAQDKTAVDMLTSLELDGALGTAAKTVGLFKNDPTSHFVSKKVTPNADGKTFKVEGDLTMAGDTQTVSGDGEVVQDDGTVLVVRTTLKIDPELFSKAFGAAKAMMSSLEIDAKLYATKDPNAAGSGSGSDEKKDNAEGEKSAEEQKKEAEAKDPAKASAEASEKGSEETPKSSDQASGMAGNYIVVPEKSEVNVTADMMGTKTSGKSPVKEGKITYSRDAQDKTAVDMLTSLELDGALGTASKTVGLFKNDPTSHFVSKKVTPNADGKTFKVEGDLTMAGDTQTVSGDGEVVQDDGNVLVVRTTLKIDPELFSKAFGAAKAMMSSLEIDAKLYATKDPNAAGSSGNSGGEGKGAPSGGVAQVPGSDMPASANASGRTYKVIPNKSEVTVNASGVQDKGKAPLKSGKVLYKSGQLEKSSWEVLASLQLEGQLGKDVERLGLFKAKPEAKFVSKRISPDGSGKYSVEGELTLENQTETVKGTAELVNDDGNNFAVNAVFEIDPSVYSKTLGMVAPLVQKLTLDTVLQGTKKGKGEDGRDEYTLDPQQSEVNIIIDLLDTEASGKTPVKEGQVVYTGKDALDKTAVDVTTMLDELDGMLGTAADMIGLFDKGAISHFVSKKVTPDAKGGYNIEGDLTMGADTAPATGHGEIVQDDGKTLVMHTVLDMDPTKYPAGLKDISTMVKKMSVDATIYASTDEEPKPVESKDAAVAQPAGTELFKVAPEESSVNVSGTAAGMPVNLTVKIGDGNVFYSKAKPEDSAVDLKINFDPEDPANSAIKPFIQMGGLPDIRFITKAFRKDANGGLDLDGELQIGKLSIPVKPKGKMLSETDTELKAETEFKITPAEMKELPGEFTVKTNIVARKDGGASATGGKDKVDGAAKGDGKDGAKSPGDAAGGLGNYTVVPEKSEVNVTADMMGTKTSGKSPVKEGKITYSRDAQDKTAVDMLTSLELDGALGTASKTVGLFKNDPTSHFVSKKVTPNADGKTFKVEGELTMAGDTQTVSGDGEVVQDDGNVLVVRTTLKIDPELFSKAFGAAKAMMSSLEIDATLYATKNPDATGGKDNGGQNAGGTGGETPQAGGTTQTSNNAGAQPPVDATGGLVNYIVVPEKSEVNVTADMMGTKTSGKSPVKEGKLSYSGKAPDKTSVDMLTSLELDGALGTASKTVGLFKDDPTSHFVSKKVTPNADGKTFKVEGELTMAGDTQTVSGDGEVLQDDGNVLVVQTKLKIDPQVFSKAFGAAKAMVSGLEIDAKLYATKDPNSPAASAPGGAPVPGAGVSGPDAGAPPAQGTGGSTVANGTGRKYKVIADKSEVTVNAAGLQDSGKAPVKEGKLLYKSGAIEKSKIEVVASLDLEGQLGIDAKKLGLFKDNPEAKFVSKSVKPDGSGKFIIEGDLTLGKQTKSVKGTAELVTDDGQTLAMHLLFEIAPTTFFRTFGVIVTPMLRQLNLDITLLGKKKGPGDDGLDEYTLDPQQSDVGIIVDVLDVEVSGETPVKEGQVIYAGKDALDKTSLDVVTLLDKLGGVLGAAAKTIKLFDDGATSHFVSKKVTPDNKGGYNIEGDLTMGADTAPATGHGEIVQDDGKTLVLHTVLDLDPTKYPAGLKEASAIVKKMNVDVTIYAVTDEEAVPPATGDANKGGANNDPNAAPKPEQGNPGAGGGTSVSQNPSDAAASEYVVVPEKSEVSVTADMMGTKTSGKSPVKEGKINYSAAAKDKTAVDMLTSLELDGALGTAAKTVGLFKDDPTSHFVSKKVTPNADGKTFKVEGDLTMAGDTQPVTGEGELLQDDGKVLVISTKLKIDPEKFSKALGAAKAMMSGLEIDAKLYAERNPNAKTGTDAGAASDPAKPGDSAPAGGKPEDSKGGPADDATTPPTPGNPSKDIPDSTQATEEELPAGTLRYNVVPEESKLNVKGTAGVIPIDLDLPVSGGEVLVNSDDPTKSQAIIESRMTDGGQVMDLMRPLVESLGGTADGRLVTTSISVNPDESFHVKGNVSIGKLEVPVELDVKPTKLDEKEIRLEGNFDLKKASIPQLPGDVTVSAVVVARTGAPKSMQGGAKGVGAGTNEGLDLPKLPKMDEINKLLNGDNDGSTFIFSPKIELLKRGCTDPREDNIEDIKALYSPTEEKFFFRFVASELGALPVLPGMPSAPGAGKSVLPFKGRYQSSFWLVATPGPVPLPMMQQYAVLYADLAKRKVTVYVYNGIPGGLSFSTQKYLGTFDNALHSREEKGRLIVTMMLDVKELNNLGLSPMWQGVKLGKKTGFWFHSSYNPMISYAGDGNPDMTSIPGMPNGLPGVPDVASGVAGNAGAAFKKGALGNKGAMAAEDESSASDAKASEASTSDTPKDGFAKLNKNGAKLVSYPLGFDGPFLDTFITPGVSTKKDINLGELGAKEVAAIEASGGDAAITGGNGGDKDKIGGGGDAEELSDKLGDSIEQILSDAVTAAGGPHDLNLENDKKYKDRRFNWCTFQEELANMKELAAGEIVSVTVSGALYGFTDIDTVDAECLSDLAMQIAASSDVKEISIDKAGLPPVKLRRVASEHDKAERMFEMLNMDAANQQFFAYGKNKFKLTIVKEDGTTVTAEHTLNVPRQ